MKLIKPLAATALLIAFCGITVANDSPDVLRAPNLDSITVDDLKADVYFLASDEMAGRETCKPENKLTAAYIRSRMLAAGVEPAGENGGYLQEVKFKYNAYKQPPTLTCTGGETDVELKYGEEFVSTGSLAGIDLQTGIVFAGYAVKDDNRKYNDIEGLDLKGKIALIMRYEPSGWARAGRNPFSRSAFLDTKEKLLRDAGASCILMVTAPKSLGASDNRRQLPSPDGSEKSPPLELDLGQSAAQADAGLPFFHISVEACDKLLGGEGKTAEAQAAFDAAEFDKRPDLSALRVNLHAESTVQESTDTNVAGMIRGELDEWIVFGAHHDHIGYGYFGAQDARKGGMGQIHNGADDNASGVSTVLEIAEALATSGVKPRRSFLFLTFTGEEKGLLGSEWYCAHPLVPHEKTIAMINIDMIGRIKDGKLSMDGTACSQMLDKHCKAAGQLFPELKLTYSDQPPMPQSDHWAFYSQAGVPVFFPFGGFNAEMHTALDDPETINYIDMVPTVKLLFEIAWRLSEDPAYTDYTGPVKDSKGPDGKPRDPKAARTTDPGEEKEEEFSVK